MNGGILQTFGSGHSYAAAIEIAGRAGGLIPAKAIEDRTMGMFEIVEGVGTRLMENAYADKNDCFVLISNSGRNPLSIEIAKYAKDRGCKIIVVTSLEVSKALTSRHSSGTMLYEYADAILDNRGVEGDSAISVEGLPVKVCGLSSIAADILLNSAVLEAIELMVSKGFIPPVYISENVDGGHEYNLKLKAKYADRIFRKP
jgi:uncharacterized phosphosugar-binding protein